MEIAGNAQKCHYNYQNKKTSMIDGCLPPTEKNTITDFDAPINPMVSANSTHLV
jgi:hypothetical protein